MTPQLTSLMAATRAAEQSRAAKYARVLADEPQDKTTVRRPSWLVRLRAASPWPQECAEHQL